MYVYHNTEARPCNHSCSGESISITYCEYVALGIQHAMRTRCNVICGLANLYIFLHDFIKDTILGKSVIENKMCDFIFSTTFV
jgi:hypothetical protein